MTEETYARMPRADALEKIAERILIFEQNVREGKVQISPEHRHLFSDLLDVNVQKESENAQA